MELMGFKGKTENKELIFKWVKYLLSLVCAHCGFLAY